MLSEIKEWKWIWRTGNRSNFRDVIRNHCKIKVQTDLTLVQARSAKVSYWIFIQLWDGRLWTIQTKLFGVDLTSIFPSAFGQTSSYSSMNHDSGTLYRVCNQILRHEWKKPTLNAVVFHLISLSFAQHPKSAYILSIIIGNEAFYSNYSFAFGNQIISNRTILSSLKISKNEQTDGHHLIH